MAVKRLLKNYIEPVTISEHKAMSLLAVKALFKSKASRPEVLTASGYTIHGSYTDLMDFEIGRELGLPQIRDIDNVFHDVDDAGYADILTAIKTNGLLLKQAKWVHSDAISNLKTIQEVLDYDITTGW